MTGRQIGRGAVAGLVGAAAMHTFRTIWRVRTHSKPEMDIFGLDRESDINSMQMLAGALMNTSFEERDAERVATVFHYAYGAAAGSFYALATRYATWIRSGRGTLYGMGIWLLGDEIPITLTGVTNIRNKGAASHIGALCAHLLYGSVTDLVLRSVLSCRE